MGFCLLSYVDVEVEVEEGILINQIHSFTLGGGDLGISCGRRFVAGVVLAKASVWRVQMRKAG